MQLIDRYLEAVRQLLPAGQQDDIINELSDNIQSQMEDRQAALHRPLTEAEEEDIIRKHGHPLQVAGRYLPRQYLIGPTFFPYWWLTLKIALSVAFAAHSITSAAFVAVGKPLGEALGVFLAFFNTAFHVFFAVTLVFAILDYAIAKYPPKRTPFENWRPSRLPNISLSEKRRSLKFILSEFVVSTSLFLYWLSIPRYPFFLFGPAAFLLKLTPAWRDANLLVFLLLFTPVALKCILLFRPKWTGLRELTPVLSKAIAFAMLCLLLRTHDWVAAAQAASEPVASAINYGIHIAILIACIVVGLQFLWEVRGVYRK